MRTLRVKLILTFLAISLTGTLLSAYFIHRRNETSLDQLLRQQAKTGFVQDAQQFYDEVGTWNQIEQSILDRIPRGPNGEFLSPPPPFTLADEQGQIVFANGRYQRGQLVSAQALAEGIPIMSDGIRVGTAIELQDLPPPRNTAEETFLAEADRALVWSALGATAVAVLLGMIIARGLIRPLQELAAASRAVAQGSLKQEVPVRTRDELGELARAFNQMSHELDRANAQRQQMTADIAHELRTPLTVLSGYLESMHEGVLKPTPARLEMLDEEVQSLKRLVEDLRTLSLADAGELTLHCEPVSPHLMLQRTYRAFLHRANQQEVALQIVADPDLPSIYGDAERLNQVLGNLASNALRYTPAGGTITLQAHRTQHNGKTAVILQVKDTGSGIAPDKIPHIFDRFYRIDSSRQQKGTESGLGLAIVRSIIDAHNGTIRAESTPGKGTIFTLQLPTVDES